MIHYHNGFIMALNNVSKYYAKSCTKFAQKLTYVPHICSWSLPFSNLPSVCPALGFLVEKLNSMLEAGEVIKQSGKDFLSALPRERNMFTVSNNIMNQIYWVNASLKSVSPINGLAHNVPVSDLDAFDIGEPAPAALPSPPSIPIPVPQPGTSQTQLKKKEGYCCIWQPGADGGTKGRTGTGTGG